MYTDYGYDYSYDAAVATSAASGLGAGTLIFSLAIYAFFMFCLVKIYMKAGRKWWEALIPIYNFYVITQIAGLEIIYFILYFIPFANIYALFKTYIELAKKFGKTTGFGICMIFFAPICIPILAFDKSTYSGLPGVQPTNPSDLNQQPIYARNVDNNIPEQTIVNGVAPVEQPAPIAEPTPVTPVEQPAPIAEPTPVAPVEQPAPIVEPTPVAPVEQPAPIAEPVAPATKFCPQCGAQIPAEATFCPQCGANV